MRRCTLPTLCILAIASLAPADELPTDNPIGTFYSGDLGYPAWTDQIEWSNVIDMKAYAKGTTDFERFENARDQLAAQGGGVLYYPAGTYDFSEGPFDGPLGRGLMLPSGVVIRGEAPRGKPLATKGDLDLPTKFVFGFTRHKNDIDLGKSKPETPRDWNLIGLMPPRGGRIGNVTNVGIAWVHLVGAVVYFGPDIQWGKTWATAGSWKSVYVKKSWANRQPEGTHPWDPFAGGGRDIADIASGRFIFGCQFEHAAVMNDAVKMGRPDHPEGFGEDGFYMHKFGPRIGAYGNQIFVANNSTLR